MISSKVTGSTIALTIGAVAGYLFFQLGIPLPWMMGPMIFNTAASMMRVPVHAPLRLRPFVIPVIGVMLGASVTAEVLGRLPEWVVTLVVMVPFLLIAASVSFLVYLRLGKYDRVTAFFSAMPGGLNEMILMGASFGGNERKIALAHGSRILVTIAFVGIAYGLFLGVRSNAGGVRNWVGIDALSAMDWLVLAGCAMIGTKLGQTLKFPAANLLGPMLLSAAAHAFHLVEIAPPSLFVICAQIVLGTAIGCRFVGVPAREIFRDIGLGVVSCGGMLIVAVTFSFITAALTHTPVEAVFLAYSPGGLTEMSLLALAMGQEVAYVSVMHILRILMVIVVAPLVFRRTPSGP